MCTQPLRAHEHVVIGAAPQKPNVNEVQKKNKKTRQVQVNLNPDEGDKFGDFPTERTEQSTAGGGEDKGSA